MHVRLEGRAATIRPIAGTRPRGADARPKTCRWSESCWPIPKERAEHVMLVDLARNDLGRVCEYGTVHVPELMGVERYSHVMHIVSQVEGQLRPELDAFDLMRATFPAGTVSGAPKIRAMQIIRELEPGAARPLCRRGRLLLPTTARWIPASPSAPWSCAVQTVSVQAGAGIVADSDPEREYQETVNKARALADRRCEMAEN